MKEKKELKFLEQTEINHKIFYFEIKILNKFTNKISIVIYVIIIYYIKNVITFNAAIIVLHSRSVGIKDARHLD